MLVTTKIGIDLQRPSYPAVINAVQGDQNTRRLEIALYSGSVAWQVPDGVTVAMRYCKPDNTKGYYDTMPDGSPAFTVSENTVSILLAPQMLTVPGTVPAQVVLLQEAQVLSTFGIQIRVESDPSVGVVESEDYLNWLQWIKTELDDYLEQLKVNGEFVGGTVVGDINLHGKMTMNGNPIVGLPTPAATSQPVTKGYADDTYLHKAGGDLTGELRMNGQPITGLNIPTENDQAANMGFVNQQVKKAAPRNLLDNSDWRVKELIVNQRGEASYDGGIYMIDRWKGANAKITVNDGSISVLRGDRPYGLFAQFCSHIVAGKKYTYAAENKAGERVILVFEAAIGMVDKTSAFSNANETITARYSTASKMFYVGFVNTGDSDMSIVWCALYEGEYTLDTLPEYRPKGYGAELAECRRYFQNYNASGANNAVYQAVARSNTKLLAVLPLGEMRVNPTTNYKGTFKAIQGDTVITGLVPFNDAWLPGGMKTIGFMGTNFNLGTTYIIASESADSEISFSADL